MLKDYTQRLLKHKDLKEVEARNCLELILSKETSDDVVASFLTALARKGEKSDEIAGFAQGMREHAISIRSSHSKLIDTAGTGGGLETFNISTASAFVIAGAGLAVAKHGNRAVTSRCGSADLLDVLGVRIDRPPEIVQKSLEKIGIAFMFAPLFHPAMKRVALVRRKLGHRTIFNMLGPLTNPASAAYQLIGVYSQDLTEKMGRALMRLGCKRAWVVHSHDGMDELSSKSPVRVTDVTGSKVESFDLDPRDLGFDSGDVTELSGGSPEENALLVKGILENRIKTGARQVVVLNAAAALHIAGEGELTATIKRAEESIDSGAARQKLADLVRAYETA